MNIAISDSPGILEFYEAADDAYSSLKDTKRKNILRVHPVVVSSIDELISNLKLDRINFIKIDVEGFEHNVLKGMIKTLKIFKPTIFCEIYKGKNSNMRPEETIQMVCSNNYSAFVISDGRLVTYQSHDDSLYNYVFLPNS